MAFVDKTLVGKSKLYHRGEFVSNDTFCQLGRAA